MKLICPAITPVALRDAVDAGAGAVRCCFAGETRAGQLPASHFTRPELTEAIEYARAGGTRVVVAIDNAMRMGSEALWTQAVDDAVALGADAVAVADIGLLAYVADRYPMQRRHVALQLSAASASHIAFLVEAFGISRAVLPRGLLVEEVLQIARTAPCEIEVAASGMLQRRGGVTAGPSLDILAHLGALRAAGVAAITVEDAPRGSAYVRQLLTEIAAAADGQPRAA
ncbi:MAG TPA: peptidase U32 family protein [Devosia sp.]